MRGHHRWASLGSLLLAASAARCSCEEPLTKATVRMSVAPAELDFGEAYSGEAVERSVVVTSIGDLPLTLQAFGVVDDPLAAFAVLRGRTATLAPGQSMTITLRGAISAIERQASARLRIESNADDAATVFVPLSIRAKAGFLDGGAEDAEPAEVGALDAAAPDAVETLDGDAGALDGDAGAPDAPELDAAEADATEADAGWPDAGWPDAGASDAGPPDASTVGCPAPRPLAQGYNPGLAWDGQRYGFSFRRTIGVQHSHVAFLDPQANLQTPPGEIDLQTEPIHSQDNWIAAGDAQFGVVWSTLSGISFQIVDLQGTRVGPLNHLASSPYGASVAWNSVDREWGVAYLGELLRYNRQGVMVGAPSLASAHGTPELVFNVTDQRWALSTYDFAQSRVELELHDRSGAMVNRYTVWTATAGKMLDGNAGNQRVRLAWSPAHNEYALVVREIPQNGSSVSPMRFVFVRVAANGSVLSTRELLPTGNYGYNEPFIGPDGDDYLLAYTTSAPRHSLFALRVDRDGQPLSGMECPASDWVYYPTIGLGPGPHPLLYNANPDAVMWTTFP